MVSSHLPAAGERRRDVLGLSCGRAVLPVCCRTWCSLTGVCWRPSAVEPSCRAQEALCARKANHLLDKKFTAAYCFGPQELRESDWEIQLLRCFTQAAETCSKHLTHRALITCNTSIISIISNICRLHQAATCRQVDTFKETVVGCNFTDYRWNESAVVFFSVFWHQQQFTDKSRK